jgi:hypothetical protein
MHVVSPCRALGLLFFFLVHRQHPLRDGKAAEDVDAREDDRDQPQIFGGRAAGGGSAPTIITEEIAFVTAISGVCSAGVTDQTT